ncbi:MAG: hypothetical protein AMXMBFR47_42080 [Planctomycetota bacterium]
MPVPTTLVYTGEIVLSSRRRSSRGLPSDERTSSASDSQLPGARYRTIIPIRPGRVYKNLPAAPSFRPETGSLPIRAARPDAGRLLGS